MSMMPGIIVMPSESITRAPGGILIDASGPAATMRLPSITTAASSTGGPPKPSMRRPPARTSDSAWAETAAKSIATISRRMAVGYSHEANRDLGRPSGPRCLPETRGACDDVERDSADSAARRADGHDRREGGVRATARRERAERAGADERALALAARR